MSKRNAGREKRAIMARDGVCSQDGAYGDLLAILCGVNRVYKGRVVLRKRHESIDVVST